MSMHSVIDLEADENAQSIKAINESILWGAMQDIARTQGIEALETVVDDNLAVLKAGVR